MPIQEKTTVFVLMPVMLTRLLLPAPMHCTAWKLNTQ